LTLVVPSAPASARPAPPVRVSEAGRGLSGPCTRGDLERALVGTDGGHILPGRRDRPALAASSCGRVRCRWDVWFLVRP